MQKLFGSEKVPSPFGRYLGQLPIIINNKFKQKLPSGNLQVLFFFKQVSIRTLPGINSSASGVCVVEASSSTQSVASNDHQQRADENQASASDHLQLNTEKEDSAGLKPRIKPQ